MNDDPKNSTDILLLNRTVTEQIVNRLFASKHPESEIITIDVDYDNLVRKALAHLKETNMDEDNNPFNPNQSQIAAASALAHALATAHEPAMPKFAITTKGSEAFFDEKEVRLSALVDVALKAKNEALDAMNADLEQYELDSCEILTQLSVVEHDIDHAKATIVDIDTDIAEKKELIASINQQIATLNEHRQHVVERTMPSLQFQHSERESKLTAIKGNADGVRAKHARRVDSATKDHEKAHMRLTRLRLRRPKASP